MIDPKAMAARTNKIHELVRTVMKEGVHFGRVPGCGDKPSLLLPGAQVLKVAFKIATRYMVEDISLPGEKTFRVTAEVYDQTNGAILGYGVGECSSSEDKYAWRKAVCDEEFENTPDDMRRLKYSKGRNNDFYTTQQIRTNPADIANTVLKMATKRADVHGTINVTSASEVFTQDLEDLPDGYEINEGSSSGTKPPVKESDVSFEDGESGDMPTEEQIKKFSLINTKQAGLLYGKCKSQKVAPESIAAFCKIKNIHWITWRKTDPKCFEKILKTVEDKPEFFKKYEIKREPTKAAEAPQEPEVMGAEDFVGLAVSAAKSVGLSQDKAEIQVDMEFGFKTFADVPADQQSKVIDFLSAQQEQAGA